MAHFLAPILDAPDAPWELRHATRDTLVATSIETAFDSETRRKGLLGRDGLEPGSALVIAPCNAVHTFFMRFPIDVAFVDRQGRVLKRLSALRPWRVAVSVRAFAAIELPAYTLDRAEVSALDAMVLLRAGRV